MQHSFCIITFIVVHINHSIRGRDGMKLVLRVSNYICNCQRTNGLISQSVRVDWHEVTFLYGDARVHSANHPSVVREKTQEEEDAAKKPKVKQVGCHVTRR